jgi:hypothetical protein
MFYLSQELFSSVSETRSHGIVALGDLSTFTKLIKVVFGLKMENLSLGGHLIPEWFCFWMSWWFLKACETY